MARYRRGRTRATRRLREDRPRAPRCFAIAGSNGSGKTTFAREYLPRRWKQAGYFIKIVFLRIDSPELALKRIAARVRQGGHDVPAADVARRFGRSRRNFEEEYRPLADAWELYDNSGQHPVLLEKWP